MDKLTREQMEALVAYRAWCKGRGVEWRRQLADDWMRAGTDWDGPYHLLHQIRNQQGPSWLVDVQIYEVEPDCGWRPG